MCRFLFLPLPSSLLPEGTKERGENSPLFCRIKSVARIGLILKNASRDLSLVLLYRGKYGSRHPDIDGYHNSIHGVRNIQDARGYARFIDIVATQFYI